MLTIRTYLPSDYDSVWALYVDGLTTTNTNAGNGYWNEDMRQIETTYLNGKGEFLVGFVENNLVAMGAIRRVDDACAEIKRMRVRSAFHRRGYGQAILTELERRATELQYRQLKLDTTTLQDAAQKFYTKNGYEETDRSTLQRAGREFELIYYSKSIRPVRV